MFTLLQVTTDVAEEQGEVTLSFLDLALKGGWIMIPLFLLSVTAVYIFVERYFAIRKASKTDSNFMNRIREYIHEDKIDAALALCRSQNTPVARMIEKGIQRIGRPLPDVNAAIENVGNLEISKLEESLPFLATIAGGAPMLGFLGTVIGMIRAFYDMSMAGNNIDVGLLSNGIYTAMVTTVAGLVVGIFAYFGYNFLVARIEKVVFNLEANTSEFMDLLYEPVS
ncbi:MULTISPECIES: MotA/TolQ/ExbB proton channel family protein [Tenuifilum]|jgi:biopolymer transport protein ExbB|uniref:MotA/TolQ/ExbB proton channel family protein n=2 Tax=Tenuifilum thalassicum TaxID=2590900 RepID=A0A7D4CIH9_9BACT|nr:MULTISPECIES: MotA/TolQ/ExbB proton channel family protein [Tenuifilum]QKG81206.1 MotA/TolQ/ExbB proton channel family protein [Tenuifilum thalassicum]